MFKTRPIPDQNIFATFVVDPNTQGKSVLPVDKSVKNVTRKVIGALFVAALE